MKLEKKKPGDIFTLLLGLDKDKVYDVEIVEHTEKKKRSLDANAYYWVLINKIGDALRTSKEEIHEEMLRRYGQSRLTKIKNGLLDMLDIKYYDVIDENDDEQIVRVYIPSHKLDSQQFSILLDGVVDEAKEMGLEVATPEQLANMKSLMR